MGPKLARSEFVGFISQLNKGELAFEGNTVPPSPSSLPPSPSSLPPSPFFSFRYFPSCFLKRRSDPSCPMLLCDKAVLHAHTPLSRPGAASLISVDPPSLPPSLPHSFLPSFPLLRRSATDVKSLMTET
jgi:hypothetical protein